jgi:hypothetical protein
MTNANNQQPKTETQRLLIATAMESMLNVAYDWGGILTDAQRAVHGFWQSADEWSYGQKPSAVVCSSLADWAYEQVNMPNPGGQAKTRLTTPGDWDAFMLWEEWK